jgi:hypothetical protein
MIDSKGSSVPGHGLGDLGRRIRARKDVESII